jgi:hypothetical protein
LGILLLPPRDVAIFQQEMAALQPEFVVIGGGPAGLLESGAKYLKLRR